jgi:acyl-CoA thioesterase-2
MSADFTGPLRGTPLETSVLESLDALERALRLEALGDNRFRASNERNRFGRIFGGQLIAQAMCAASATVDKHVPHSLHAYFVATGDCQMPLDIAVEPVRDGRSMATRQVSISQGDRTLLRALVSFHTNAYEPELTHPPLHAPGPDEMPLLQHWAQHAPSETRINAQTWIDVPPPIEMRVSEPTNFLGGTHTAGSRSHWMRLPRAIDPALHGAVLGYASDYLMLDMAFRNHPQPGDFRSVAAVSLDHALWLHSPVRFDEWHLYTQDVVALAGHRALIRGAIRDAEGRAVASTVQEVLIRPTDGR